MTTPRQQAESLLNLNDLTKWLETKNPSGEYYFCNIRYCLLARYLRSHHIKVTVGGDYVNLGGDGIVRFNDDIRDVASELPHTYGAALERARARARTLRHPTTNI